MSTSQPTKRAPSDGRHLSPWAILSIASSLFVLCPFTTVLGPLFGLKALSEMRTDPRLTGRRMARAGIFLGTIATAVWIGIAIWWHVNVRRPMFAGPVAALTAGANGDLDGFRNGFCCESQQASKEESIVFLAELSQRYGRFVSIRQDDSPRDIAQPTGNGFRKRIPYVLEYERATVLATADFVLIDGDGVFIMEFARLHILDDTDGDMTYPRSASDSGSIEPPAPATDLETADNVDTT